MKLWYSLLPALLLSWNGPLIAQEFCCDRERLPARISSFTASDTILASQIEVLRLPESYRHKTLPAIVDNSVFPWWPGISAQWIFYSCQQYAGVHYTFAYEMNRLRNLQGNLPENLYPAHYTWNFLNFGERYVGVNFLHSFQALMQQGHMLTTDYGSDTAYGFLGWPSGYDRYEKAFPNRIRKIWSIPINSEEGILTVKHYLNDHLDGSPSGGVVCFTAASPGNLTTLPEGTPEGGKWVEIYWQPWATHGMTLIGYNDSIRYDLNQDGQYTNHIDITGDGEVDARDWEIGGFKLANSYGDWWADSGYAYALYSSFAFSFEQGGVWNNCVYAVEPDPEYEPLLGMECTIRYNQRDKIRLVAGVSTDTSAHYPAFTMELPFFRFQGGPHAMQGNDTVPGMDEIEVGLDVTPLLSYVDPGKPARFFLVVEERDPYNTGAGMVRNVIFHDYSGAGETFPSPETDVIILNQGTTYLSAVGTVDFDPVKITTAQLPSSTPGVPYAAQLEAAGGDGQYRWTLAEEYCKSPVVPAYQGEKQTRLYEHSPGQPFATVALPFSFPFFGKEYDTAYVNSYGFIEFGGEHVPYPYLIDWYDMLRNIPAIFPAFCWNFKTVNSENDGMWMKAGPDKVTFLWELSVDYHEIDTDNKFELDLYPDGHFEFHYGECVNLDYTLRSVSGYSRGDNMNFAITDIPNLSDRSNLSERYEPPAKPQGISISGSGLLEVQAPDTSVIYSIKVKVTDESLMTDTRDFQFSSGLIAVPMLKSESGMLVYGEESPVDLLVTNTGQSVLPGIEFLISCSDTSVIITDSTETLASLPPGSPQTLEQAFSFHLKNPLPNGSVLRFNLLATAPDHHWDHAFTVTVAAPDIRLTRYIIHDGVNGLLDPGEVADLEIEIGNFGLFPADSLTISAIPGDTAISVLPPATFTYESCPSNSAIREKIRLTASRFVQPGALRPLYLVITAASGLELHYTLNLRLGSKPVAIISLASTTSSVYNMKTALDSIGVAYDSYNYIDNIQLGYSALFLVLGTTTGSHFLSEEEGWFFANYLRDGGNLYIESYAEWYYNDVNSLHPLLHFTTEKVPAYDFTEMAGSSGAFIDDMEFQYMGTSNYAIFDFIPSSPGFSLLSNTDEVPHALQIAADEEDYRSIASMVEFGKLADGPFPSTKTELMRRYLDFFNVIFKGPWPYFHADSTTVCRFHSVSFTDDSFDNVISWHWEFPGGEPASSEQQHPVVIYPENGSYDVSLTVSDGTSTHTLTRNDYVRVEVCAGVEDTPALQEVILFPNPADDRFSILFPGGNSAGTDLILLNLSGNIILRTSIPDLSAGQSVSVSTAGLPEGLYILRLINIQGTVVRKVIVNR